MTCSFIRNTFEGKPPKPLVKIFHQVKKNLSESSMARAKVISEGFFLTVVFTSAVALTPTEVEDFHLDAIKDLFDCQIRWGRLFFSTKTKTNGSNIKVRKLGFWP